MLEFAFAAQIKSEKKPLKEIVHILTWVLNWNSSSVAWAETSINQELLQPNDHPRQRYSISRPEKGVLR